MELSLYTIVIITNSYHIMVIIIIIINCYYYHHYYYWLYINYPNNTAVFTGGPMFVGLYQ